MDVFSRASFTPADATSFGRILVPRRQSEIATMKYVAEATTIPVPEIFGYNIDLDMNPVGLSYILMHCIEGNMIFDLGGLEVLNPEQRAKLDQSIASIQVCSLEPSVPTSLTQLVPTVRCTPGTDWTPGLGRLVLDSNGNVGIGHLSITFGFQGPFDLLADYFSSWVDQSPKFKNLARLHDLNLKNATQSFPKRLESLIKTLSRRGVYRRYPIIHPDFLLHNILLNDKFEVVGVINWEHAHSAPAGVFAARANMFVHLNTTNATLDWDDHGAECITDIEATKNLNPGDTLSVALKTLMAILGWCVQLYEEGRAISFDIVMDRIEAELE